MSVRTTVIHGVMTSMHHRIIEDVRRRHINDLEGGRHFTPT